MWLKHLYLENFRGFSKLDVEFAKSGPTVFIGANGAGKSTILSAIGMVLYAFSNGVFGERPIKLPEEKDIRAGATEALIRADMYYQGLSASWQINRKDGKIDDRNPYQAGQSLKLSEQINLPLVMFLHGNRNLRIFNKKRRTLHIKQLQAWRGSMSAGSYGEFVEWFEQEENIENEIRLRESSGWRSPALTVVRRAILTMLTELKQEAFSDLRISRIQSEGEPGPKLVVDKNGTTISLEQLSDGEREIILMTGDISHRLEIANPTLDDVLAGEGIVLLDEIELHLHPRWQQQILPALTKTFPKLQFVVTTHSPQVLSGAPNESLRFIQNFQVVENAGAIYGRTSQHILGLMGVPERAFYSEAIRRLGELLAHQKLSEAKQLLVQLQEQLGDDPTLLQAQSEIAWQEAL